MNDSKRNLLMLLVAAMVLGGCSGGDSRQPETRKAASEQDMAASSTARPAKPLTTDEALVRCRAAVAELGSDLKVALRKGLQEGGPAAALDVCHTQAPGIAAGIGEREGMEVGRTSLKPRNPDNAPDAWETAVMTRFAADKAAGAGPRELQKWEVVEGPDGGRLFRYMKAIPTQPLCLKCHGSSLAPEVRSRLAELYPSDQATGFALGDLRGAFSVTMPLEPRPAGD